MLLDDCALEAFEQPFGFHHRETELFRPQLSAFKLCDLLNNLSDSIVRFNDHLHPDLHLLILSFLYRPPALIIDILFQPAIDGSTVETIRRQPFAN